MSVVVLALLEGLAQVETIDLEGGDLEDAVMLSDTVPASVYRAAKAVCKGKELNRMVDSLVETFSDSV